MRSCVKREGDTPIITNLMAIPSGTGEEHYNDNAFDYFILFVLAIVTIPTTFVFVKRRLFPTHSDIVDCPCSACKQRETQEKAKKSKIPSALTILKAVVLIILWLVFILLILNVKNRAESPGSGHFDPYAILGLETVRLPLNNRNYTH